MRRLGVSTAAAIEDSEAGIRSAHAAGLHVIAIPNPHFPPADEALALADEVLPDLDAVRSKLCCEARVAIALIALAGIGTGVHLLPRPTADIANLHSHGTRELGGIRPDTETARRRATSAPAR